MTIRRIGTRAFQAISTMLLSAAVLAIPAGVRAQDWATHRAERMEAQANNLSDQRHKWEKAAWLYREAAGLRETGDPEAVVDLQMAGRLAFYMNDGPQALTDLEAAGERAMEGGDVFTAANLLVDAAWVATRLGKHEKARELTDEARVHASSTVLSAAVRDQVLDRVEEALSDQAVASTDGQP